MHKDDDKNTQQSSALEQRAELADGRLFSPSSARNKDPICNAWLELGVKEGRVLEIGSGTGEHAAALLKACPSLNWIASDIDKSNHASIRAWAAHEGVSDRLEGPLAVDAATSSDAWDVAPELAAVYCANMIHISPWQAGRGVIHGAADLLAGGGRLFFYGPYKRGGEHTAASNAAFDDSLRSRCADWGVRDLEGEVAAEATLVNLALDDIRTMPSNNLVVVFEKK